MAPRPVRTGGPHALRPRVGAAGEQRAVDRSAARSDQLRDPPDRRDGFFVRRRRDERRWARREHGAERDRADAAGDHVNPPGTGVVNGSATLSPSATSSLPVVLTVDGSSSPANACSLTELTPGSYTVNYVHAGSCVLDANQAGGGGYEPAAPVQQTITIGRASQSVDFSSTSPGTVTYGSTPYVVAATSTSGAPVTISLDGTSTGCALSTSTDTVSFTGVGTCVIDANAGQTGDYLAALQQQQQITVDPASQTVPFTAPSVGAVGGRRWWHRRRRRGRR